jgi:hypothetical protein
MQRNATQRNAEKRNATQRDVGKRNAMQKSADIKSQRNATQHSTKTQCDANAEKRKRILHRKYIITSNSKRSATLRRKAQRNATQHEMTQRNAM